MCFTESSKKSKITNFFMVPMPRINWLLQLYFLQAYQNVVKLAPQHFEARRALSNILNKLGRPEEALHTLTQDEKAELLNPSLLYERCQLLLSEGRTEEFVKKTKLLLSRHLTDIRSREEVITLCSSRKYSQKRLTELRSLNEHESDSISVSSGYVNVLIYFFDNFWYRKK